MKHLIFWAVLSLVCVPVFLGLMTDELGYGFFAVCWAAVWWVVFNKTAYGRKMFLKGYKIACEFMGDADV